MQDVSNREDCVYGGVEGGGGKGGYKGTLYFLHNFPVTLKLL